MMNTISVSKAQKTLPSLIDNIKKQGKEYAIEVDGKKTAVLVAIDEYESLKETLEIMSDPDMMKDIKEAEEDVKAGRVYDWGEVKKELGWGKVMHVSDKARTKSKKTT